MPEIIVQGLEKLLESLSPDPTKAGEEYARMHDKLTIICETNQWSPDIVDKTMDVVARDLALGKDIQNVKAYVRGVFNLQAKNASRKAKSDSIDDTGKNIEIVDNNEDVLERLTRGECLNRCLAWLTSTQRPLFLEYYEFENGQERINKRQEMTKRLGITPAALRQQIQNIRENLQACITDCQGKHTKQ